MATNGRLTNTHEEEGHDDVDNGGKVHREVGDVKFNFGNEVHGRIDVSNNVVAWLLWIILSVCIIQYIKT